MNRRNFIKAIIGGACAGLAGLVMAKQPEAPKPLEKAAWADLHDVRLRNGQIRAREGYWSNKSVGQLLDLQAEHNRLVASLPLRGCSEEITLVNNQPPYRLHD